LVIYQVPSCQQGISKEPNNTNFGLSINIESKRIPFHKHKYRLQWHPIMPFGKQTIQVTKHQTEVTRCPTGVSVPKKCNYFCSLTYNRIKHSCMPIILKSTLLHTLIQHVVTMKLLCKMVDKGKLVTINIRDPIPTTRGLTKPHLPSSSSHGW